MAYHSRILRQILLAASVLGSPALFAACSTSAPQNDIEQFKKRQAEQESFRKKEAVAVYALVDLKQGEVIKASDVAESKVPLYKLDKDALQSKNLAIGRTVKDGIYKNQFIDNHDLKDESSQSKPQ